MTGVWALAALWLGLALVASLLSIWLLEAELLVIGATGHSAIYERMVGSRADRIVQLAQCPVLVVK